MHDELRELASESVSLSAELDQGVSSMIAAFDKDPGSMATVLLAWESLIKQLQDEAETDSERDFLRIINSFVYIGENRIREGVLAARLERSA